jgi:hypothetical protein
MSGAKKKSKGKQGTGSLHACVLPAEELDRRSGPRGHDLRRRELLGAQDPAGPPRAVPPPHPHDGPRRGVPDAAAAPIPVRSYLHRAPHHAASHQTLTAGRPARLTPLREAPHHLEIWQPFNSRRVPASRGAPSPAAPPRDFCRRDHAGRGARSPPPPGACRSFFSSGAPRAPFLLVLLLLLPPPPPARGVGASAGSPARCRRSGRFRRGRPPEYYFPLFCEGKKRREIKRFSFLSGQFGSWFRVVRSACERETEGGRGNASGADRRGGKWKGNRRAGASPWPEGKMWAEPGRAGSAVPVTTAALDRGRQPTWG